MNEMAMIEALDKAVSAHSAWKVHLRLAIMNGSSEFEPAIVKCDDKCEFGAWLYSGVLSDADRAQMPYKVVHRLHAEFHECAACVLTHAISNRPEEASDLMAGSFDECSQRLMIALAKWKRETVQAEAA